MSDHTHRGRKIWQNNKMTLHIDYNHKCRECKAFYIPYDEDIPCPRCGCVEEDRFDFIPQAADSALYNLRDGSYYPGAWYISSYADHVLHLVFIILEHHRTNGGSKFEDVARRLVNKMKWGDQEYARDHVFAIACRVYEEIQRRSPEETLKPKGGSPGNW